MIDYSNPNMVNDQRNAITQALMNVQNPPPRTGMPSGGMGAMSGPRRMPPPAALGSGPGMPQPQDPLNAAASMPGMQPPGILGQAQMGATPLAGAPPPGPVPPPGTGLGMGPTPATGAPMGPQPSVPGLLNQQPLVNDPSRQLMPPGMQPGSY